MATGKYLSLEEARKKGQIERFAKEHPSAGNETKFDKALREMTPPQLQKKGDKGR